MSTGTQLQQGQNAQPEGAQGGNAQNGGTDQGASPRKPINPFKAFVAFTLTAGFVVVLIVYTAWGLWNGETIDFKATPIWIFLAVLMAVGNGLIFFNQESVYGDVSWKEMLGSSIMMVCVAYLFWSFGSGGFTIFEEDRHFDTPTLRVINNQVTLPEEMRQTKRSTNEELNKKMVAYWVIQQRIAPKATVQLHPERLIPGSVAMGVSTDGKRTYEASLENTPTVTVESPVSSEKEKNGAIPPKDAEASDEPKSIDEAKK